MLKILFLSLLFSTYLTVSTADDTPTLCSEDEECKSKRLYCKYRTGDNEGYCVKRKSAGSEYVRSGECLSLNCDTYNYNPGICASCKWSHHMSNGIKTLKKDLSPPKGLKYENGRLVPIDKGLKDLSEKVNRQKGDKEKINLDEANKDFDDDDSKATFR